MLKIHRGRSVAATQIGADPAGGDAKSYDWDGQSCSRVNVCNDTGQLVYIRVNGSDAHPAALAGSAYDHILADNGTLEITGVRVLSLSIWFVAGGAYSYGKNHVVNGWYEGGPAATTG